MKNRIFITGVAGFIGYSLAEKLLTDNNIIVVGIDNFDSYYSRKLKFARLNNLKKFKNFFFFKKDLKNFKGILELFKKYKFTKVFNFAAQAGVRYSLLNPRSYIGNNIKGFFNILECSKIYPPKIIYYASSSSVYGDLKKYPAKEKFVGVQKNVYSLSKKFNEDLAEIYSKVYNLRLVGLRFFTVYGEWGRPDMFYLKYFKSMNDKKIINVYNNGKHYRDFTYIRDVIEILFKLMKVKFKCNHLLLNICSNKPIDLIKLIKVMNSASSNSVRIKKTLLQQADVIKTHGDNKKLLSYIKKKKFYSLEEGIHNTYEWYVKNKSLF